MKMIIILLSLFASSTAVARLEKSAYEKYSTKANFTDTTQVTWEPVDNAEKKCTEIHVKATGKPYPDKVDACSYWKKNLFQQYNCHIITDKNTNNDILGHELRHCFQGDFHK